MLNPTLHEIQTWNKRTFLSFLPHCPHLCPASREHLMRLLQRMKAAEPGWPQGLMQSLSGPWRESE